MPQLLDQPKVIKILSIDGGGMRGIIPATFLLYLEHHIGKPIREMFDLIAGTSTGGLLSCILTSPKKYSANDIVQLYYNEGPKIFARSVMHRIGAWGNIVHSKYPAKGIEEVMDKYFGESKLSELLKPVLVPSFDIQNHSPQYFKSLNAQLDTMEDFYVKDVCRCTSAAPLYFPPAQITNVAGNRTLSCVDGGVFDNNPSVSAVVEARKLWPGASVMVVSLGTGTTSHTLSYNKAKRFGAAKWLPEIVNMILDGVSEKTDYYLRELVPFDMYFRFQVDLPAHITALDIANPERLQTEQDLAFANIQENQARVDYLCAQLKTL